jgi:hypothetical protein
MKRKPTPAVLPVAIPVALPDAPRERWYRSIFTDSHGDFDTGRLLVNVVILTMCAIALTHGDKFDAQNFGIGIGSVLTGFAAYLFGDAQRPPQSAPSTVTEVKQTQVTTP